MKLGEAGESGVGEVGMGEGRDGGQRGMNRDNDRK